LRPHNAGLQPRSSFSAVRRFRTTICNVRVVATTLYFAAAQILCGSQFTEALDFEICILSDLESSPAFVTAQFMCGPQFAQLSADCSSLVAAADGILRSVISSTDHTFYAYVPFFCLVLRLLLFESNVISGAQLPAFLQFCII